MWQWFDYLIIGIIIALLIFGLVMYRDQKKKLLLRVEKTTDGDMIDIYKTIRNDKTGEEEFYYEKRKFLFQRIVVILIFIELMKDYIISRGAMPLDMLVGDNYVVGWCLILIGYPVIFFLLGIGYFAFTQFRQQGIPCIVIKLEDKPTDRFGKLLSEELVMQLLEKEKGHEIFKFYVYYDRQGRLRTSTRNIIKMLNDLTDFVELTVPLNKLPNINFEESGIFEEETKLIPVYKIARKKVVESEESDTFKYELHVWEYESVRVLKHLLLACVDKEKQRTTFMKALSFAHVFQRLSKAYDESQNRFHQLEGSVSLVVDSRVADKEETINIQKGLITKTVTAQDVTDRKIDEQAIKKAVVTSEQTKIDEIFYDGQKALEEIEKLIEAEKKKRGKKVIAK